MAKFRQISWLVLVGILVCLGTFALCVSAQSASITSTAILSLDPHSRAIKLDTAQKQDYTIDGAVPQDRIDGLSIGDRVDAIVASDGTNITSISKAKLLVPMFNRILAIGGSLLILGFVTGLVTGWKPQRLIIGLDNRYSNSKTQMAIWSAVLATSYLSTLFLRLGFISGVDGLNSAGGINIPENLAALSGFSILAFGGAKAITNQKAASAIATNQAGGAAPVPEKTALPDENSARLVRDLFQNDNGKIDIGDSQMIFVTVLAAIIYSMEVFIFQGHLELASTVTLPDVDTTLLTGFGVGQFAYLLKKMASNPGVG